VISHHNGVLSMPVLEKPKTQQPLSLREALEIVKGVNNLETLITNNFQDMQDGRIVDQVSLVNAIADYQEEIGKQRANQTTEERRADAETWKNRVNAQQKSKLDRIKQGLDEPPSLSL
jgi:hypothetical protein